MEQQTADGAGPEPADGASDRKTMAKILIAIASPPYFHPTFRQARGNKVRLVSTLDDIWREWSKRAAGASVVPCLYGLAMIPFQSIRNAT